MKKTLVLFDLDGTITKRDTLFEFTLFYHGWLKFACGMIKLSPFLFLFLAKRCSNSAIKEKFLALFFEGQSIDKFNKKCNIFSLNHLPKLVKSNAMVLLNKHLQSRHDIYIVSASIENWIDPWCADNKFGCISTRIEVKDGKITGRIHGKNCYGKEKVDRIKQLIDIASYEEVVAYGNSKGDTEMLSLANKPFYKLF